MSIRWRLSGDLVCAAMSEPEEDDTYINDRLHYQLSVISKTILADVDHEANGLWHWVHGDNFLRSIKEYSMPRERQNEWVSVKDKLPMEEYHDLEHTIVGDFLVTVTLDDSDILDDEVIILTFNSKTLKWYSCMTDKEYNWGWSVTHWMDKPLAAGDKEYL